MKYYYKQPEYFTQFRCLGGDCPKSCCDGWRVDWSDDELDYLRTAQMSDEMRDRIQNSFARLEDGKYYVELCNDARCPFHNRETDLCDIQKEIGEKYFGLTCRIYPRRYYRRENMIYRSCSSSCPAVVSYLLKNENAARYDMVLARDHESIPEEKIKVDTFKTVDQFPFIKYKNVIFDFYVELFNKDNNIKNLMILGGLAAKKISDADENGSADDIPGILDNYLKQASMEPIMRSIDEIKANYSLKYLIINNLIYDNFGIKKGDINISELNDGKKLIPEKYIYGMEKFSKVFEKNKRAMNNLAVNMFSDIFLHLGGDKESFWKQYSYFAACMAVIDVFACAAGLESSNIEKDFIDITATLSRNISHNVTGVKYVWEFLSENGIISPAHLALIIK